MLHASDIHVASLTWAIRPTGLHLANGNVTKQIVLLFFLLCES